MKIISWLRDDVSWAITVTGLILMVYMIVSIVFKAPITESIISGGITGIVALARGNGKSEKHEP